MNGRYGNVAFYDLLSIGISISPPSGPLYVASPFILIDLHLLHVHRRQQCDRWSLTFASSWEGKNVF